jgi:hypothetical protein
MGQRSYDCCSPVYWHHSDGWDVYRRDDCDYVMAYDTRWRNPALRWVPRHPGSNMLVEDAPNLSDARIALAKMHPCVGGFRLCLAPARMDSDA